MLINCIYKLLLSIKQKYYVCVINIQHNYNMTTKVEPKKEFKSYWVGLPIKEALELQEAIKLKLIWSRAKWFNKLHNKTPFTLLEMQFIAKIAKVDVDQIFELTTKQREALYNDAN